MDGLPSQRCTAGTQWTSGVSLEYFLYLWLKAKRNWIISRVWKSFWRNSRLWSSLSVRLTFCLTCSWTDCQLMRQTMPCRLRMCAAPVILVQRGFMDQRTERGRKEFSASTDMWCSDCSHLLVLWQTYLLILETLSHAFTALFIKRGSNLTKLTFLSLDLLWGLQLFRDQALFPSSTGLVRSALAALAALCWHLLEQWAQGRQPMRRRSIANCPSVHTIRHGDSGIA